MTLALNLRPVRPDEVMQFPAGGSVCLHHLDNGTYFTLNNVGSYIWELCDGLLTIEELAERVALAFGVDKATTLADLIELLENLREHQCIVLDSRSHGAL